MLASGSCAFSGLAEWARFIWPSILGCRAVKPLRYPADVSADPEYRARFNREADLAATL